MIGKLSEYTIDGERGMTCWELEQKEIMHSFCVNAMEHNWGEKSKNKTKQFILYTVEWQIKYKEGERWIHPHG